MAAYCIRLSHRPPPLQESEVAFLIRKKLVEKSDELAVTLFFIFNRRLFGHCYSRLVPGHWARMKAGSGVMIAPIVPTTAIIPSATFPGDIDLLVIPYEGDDLIISETLAIEIKIVRAKYTKQGKAPNEFGFSQANAILAHGIPYSAVAHLIVSDGSPKEQWRTVHTATLIDAETGKIGALREVAQDMMPVDLITRNFGRLKANCHRRGLGLVSAYVSFEDDGYWLPEVRRAAKNTKISKSPLVGIAKFYKENYLRFWNTPKYPPNL